MKHIKTFQSHSINENLIKNLWNTIKNQLSTWFSELRGDFKRGAEYAMDWIGLNSDMMKAVVEKIRQVSKNEIETLSSWIKSIGLNTSQFETMTRESVESENELGAVAILKKIARISGISVAALISFSAPVVAITGLIIGSGALFVAGAVITIIAWALAQLFLPEER